jgi:RNA polymerase sigma factor (sigma-70 family)
MEYEQLIQGCIENNREYQKTLFDKFAGKFMTIAKRYMKDTMLAEDVLMEGFYKIYKNLGKFKGEGSFEGWMRRIIVNTALTKLKQNKHEFNECNLVSAEAVSIDPTYYETASAEELMSLISSLPTGYRTVFNMYVVDGFSHREIATELNIQEASSRSQLFKAKELLQKRINPNT